MSAGVIAAAALYGSLGATWTAVRVRRPDARQAGAAVLAGLWCAVALLPANLAALELGWWSYGAGDVAVLGMPVSLWLGWSLVWGPVALLASRGRRVLVTILALGVVDIALMPALAPLVVLGEHWLVGEVVVLALVAFPGLSLGRLTWDADRLELRVALQVALFSALGAWLVPTLAFELVPGAWSGSWEHVFARPRWQLDLIVVAVVLLALPGLAAVREVSVVGRGTPFPYDPPQRLVTTGPYAYVANPMQLSMTALYLLLAAVSRSLTLVLAAVVAMAFSWAFAQWYEDLQLDGAFGAQWRRYRSEVRNWVPRWHPHTPEPAVVWVASTCEPCAEVGTWIDRLAPHGVERRAAEARPGGPPRRLTVEVGDVEATGIRAVGHVLERRNLAWAHLGWLLRLPVVAHLVQLVNDATGGAPRNVGSGA